MSTQCSCQRVASCARIPFFLASLAAVLSGCVLPEVELVDKLDSTGGSSPCTRGDCSALPDLWISDLSLHTASSGSEFAICLNRDPLGGDVDYGNYLHVQNIGAAKARPYSVSLGLQETSTGTNHLFDGSLGTSDYHEPGLESEWLGPTCIHQDVSAFPSGKYRVVVMVDASKFVPESNESNNSVTGDTLFTVSHDDAPRSLPINAFCDMLAGCAPGYFGYEYAGDAQCVDELAAYDPNWGQWVATLPGVVESGDYFTSCARALQTMDCSDFIATVFSGDMPSACKPKGTLPIGTSCKSSAQCASGSCLHRGWECGVCASESDGGEGSTCSSDGECTWGQYCLDGMCHAAGQEGDVCSESLICRNDLGCVSGRCRSLPAVSNASCDPNVGCDWLIGNLACNNASRCVPITSWGATSASCVWSSDHASLCRRGTCDSGTCSPWGIPRGGACSADGVCASPTICTEGVCKLLTDTRSCE